MPVRRLVRACLPVSAAAVLVTGLLAVTTTAPAGPPPPAEVVWQPCPGATAFQCARLEAPLDYDDPAAGTVSLALTRRLATDPARRIGSLLWVAGGPGSLGTGLVQGSYARLPAELRARFDIVGVDPRGVGGSTPKLACMDNASYLAEFQQAKARPGDDAFDFALASGRRFGEACLATSPGLAPYVGTLNVARDLDQVRQALGEEQISMIARSYGTYIGTVYANLFPDRLRAATLDGGYDPINYATRPYRYDRTQYVELGAAFQRFLQWCSATPELCGFGGGDPGGAFDRLMVRLDEQPIVATVGGVTGPVNGPVLQLRVLLALDGGQAGWPTLATALQNADERSQIGTLLRPFSPATLEFLTVNTTVECDDRAFPRGIRKLERKLAAEASLDPVFGPGQAYGPPGYDQSHAPTCVQWPVEPRSRYVGGFEAEGSAPIQVIGTTGDPDTPFRDAIRLSRVLENGHLLVFEAEGHTAFGRSACINDQVTRYLTELVVEDGVRCADEAPPAAAGSRAGREAALGRLMPDSVP